MKCEEVLNEFEKNVKKMIIARDDVFSNISRLFEGDYRVFEKYFRTQYTLSAADLWNALINEIANGNVTIEDKKFVCGRSRVDISDLLKSFADYFNAAAKVRESFEKFAECEL